MKKETWFVLFLIFVYTLIVAKITWELKPSPKCKEITRVDTLVIYEQEHKTKAHLEITKPAEKIQNIQRDSIPEIWYNEIIDTTVQDSTTEINLVANIWFNDSLKIFKNVFDISVAAKERMREIIKYYEEESDGQTWLLVIIAIASFLFGLIF